MLSITAKHTIIERMGAKRCFGCEKPFASQSLTRGYCKRCALRTKELFYCPQCNNRWTADWISIEWAVKCDLNFIEPCFNCKGIIQDDLKEDKEIDALLEHINELINDKELK